MAKRMQRMLDELEVIVQYTELTLREDTKVHDTWQLQCVTCGRSLPSGAKKCHPCNNTNLQKRLCTHETRVADYFSILNKAELWPTVSSFAGCSVHNISLRFARARKAVKHICDAERSCPLLTTLDLMVEKARETQDWVNGLCLDCVREGGDDESIACNHW